MTKRQARRPSGPAPRPVRLRRLTMAVTTLAVAAIAGLAIASPAFAGRSSTGKPAFYPCDRCHPVTIGADGKPTKPLPVGLKKHEIVLEVHDTLGKGEVGCLTCHDAPTANPGILKAPDGSPIPITGDVSRVCQRCHFEKYREWRAGIHGKDAPKCTAAGCHDPHTPSWIYVAALPPFQGTGFEVRAVGRREPFRPFASPPVPPEVLTPMWLVVVAGLGAAMCAAILALMIGRLKR